MDSRPFLVEIGRRLNEIKLGTWRFSISWRRLVSHSKDTRRRRRLDAVARENERAVRDMIRRWQALPPHRRTNFLRTRVTFRGSVA